MALFGPKTSTKIVGRLFGGLFGRMMEKWAPPAAKKKITADRKTTLLVIPAAKLVGRQSEANLCLGLGHTLWPIGNEFL